MQKELANWIFYEESNDFYCEECIAKRVIEINNKKEFANYIDYENGDQCGYYQDYAYIENEVECCKCGKPLFSLIDD